jgi:tryptophan synthase alpha chain
MSRLAMTFAPGEGQIGHSLPDGGPSSRPATLAIAGARRGRRDAIELGVPFMVIVTASLSSAGFRALQGVTLETVLGVCSALRERADVPLLIMSYYNLLLAYGLERFADGASKAGADGVIVPDLPPEEAEPLQAACRQAGLDLIMLIAPTSSEERIERIAFRASGFLYCVGLTGVTGARDALAASLPGFLQKVRSHTALPLAVGFGISRREHVVTIAPFADAAIVGSALIELIEKTPPLRQVAAASAFISDLKGSSALTATAGASTGAP